MKLVRIVAFALATLVSPSFAADGPKWSEWSDDLFARAQAEQRFYDEQDPTSQWYREDRSHGEPGPDVARARAEALSPEDILRDAIQTGYDEGYPLLPAQIASIRSRLGLGEAEAGPVALPALQERLATLLDQVTDRTQERHRDQGWGY